MLRRGLFRGLWFELGRKDMGELYVEEREDSFITTALSTIREMKRESKLTEK